MRNHFISRVRVRVSDNNYMHVDRDRARAMLESGAADYVCRKCGRVLEEAEKVCPSAATGFHAWELAERVATSVKIRDASCSIQPPVMHAAACGAPYAQEMVAAWEQNHVGLAPVVVVEAAACADYDPALAIADPNLVVYAGNIAAED
jgi:hypothetical protein